MPISAAIFGATGLTGRNIVSTAAALEHFSPVYTISRRPPYTSPDSVADGKLHAVVEEDTGKWAAALAGLQVAATQQQQQKPLDVVMSALGTTRAVGGLAEQWKIDHDLNIELAKAARAAGVKTYLFVSSGGTRGFLSSMVPYSKMKVGVEDAIRDMGFEQAIIMRPGAILGARDRPHTGGPWLNTAVNSLLYISQGARDAVGQDADVIAKAGLAAVMAVKEGRVPEQGKGYWVLEAKDILRMGRDEWKH
ncbi:oxidoreductase [Microdochium nivale]|nr:oxidoreductase [Microdochium nivale]